MGTRYLKFGVIMSAAILIGGGAAGWGRDDNDGQAKRRAGAVLYQVKADLTDEQAAALDDVLRKHDLVHVRRVVKGRVRLGETKAAFVREEDICKDLEDSGAVDFAEPDYLVPPDDTTPNDDRYPSQWHLPKINAPGAWDMTTGAETVIVAVCDAGVDATHPDLADNMLPGFNTVDNTDNTADVEGHGTMTSGTLGAVGNNEIGVAGVIWTVKILPIRITNRADGLAYISDMAEGITYAADHGAKVVNLSYGGANSSTIDSAATYLRGKGGLLFMSAGNDGRNQTRYPDFSSFVAVGATTSSDVKASWSTYGKFVDCVAPGVGIWTTAKGGGYANPSGTSFSSPCAAGVAALIYAVKPDFTPAQVENFIFSTCVDLGAVGEDKVYGRGRVDASAAVAAAVSAAADLPPVAEAVADPVYGIAPLEVHFDGSGSNDPDLGDGIVSFRWDFGDGAAASGPSPTVTHTYTTAGTYIATLTVTDTVGSTGADTVRIDVTQDPAKVVHVDSIGVSLVPEKTGTRAQARVGVAGPSSEAPVGGITVTGAWSGVVSGTASAVTDADGIATVASPKTRKHGTFIFTVTGLSASGYLYDPSLNVQTSGSTSN